MKKILCEKDNTLGKFYHLFTKKTEIDIDVSDAKQLSINCPCCTFWRGVITGLIAGILSTATAFWL